ncbi:hypothetical protein TNCV_4787161 [Trichonephila clavipes]|nr:hypothetical protein TNCV_4787161 [Trichonephila clavipes]
MQNGISALRLSQSVILSMHTSSFNGVVPRSPLRRLPPRRASNHWQAPKTLSVFMSMRSENASQVPEVVNFGADTVAANYVLLWFRRFSSGIFDVKDEPRTGRSVVENVDKITKQLKLSGVLVVAASPRS